MKVRSELPCLIANGIDLENPASTQNHKDRLHVFARNFLRHFIHGTPLFHGGLWNRLNLRFSWRVFNGLLIKRDPELLNVLLDEVKKVFHAATNIGPFLSPELQDRLEAFVNTFVSNIPYMDPEEGDEILLPQRNRLSGEWSEVTYRFKKMDITSQRGLIGLVLEDYDRIYAYGLEPVKDPQARPYLILMGTNYVTGQGYYLSLLSDLTPGLSVGESHNYHALHQWMKIHPDSIISGHSQGATMAMLLGSHYPESEAYCLNPVLLRQNFTRPLNGDSHSNVRIYIQEKDPVYVFGDVLPKDASVFLVSHPEGKQASVVAAHARHYLGFPVAKIEQIQNPRVDSYRRRFFNGLKYAFDRLVHPILSIGFTFAILKRKAMRFLKQNADLLRKIFFGGCLLFCMCVMATGVLTPAGVAAFLPFVAVLPEGAAYTFLLAAGMLGSAVLTYLMPKAVQLALNIVTAVTSAAAFVLVAADTLLASLYYGVKTLGQRFWKSIPEESNLSWNGSTQVSLKALENEAANRKLPPGSGNGSGAEYDAVSESTQQLSGIQVESSSPPSPTLYGSKSPTSSSLPVLKDIGQVEPDSSSTFKLV